MPRSRTIPASRDSSPSSMARSSAAPRSTPPTPPRTASLASAASWPEVRLVAVAPSARGRGVARALVDECVRRARASGASVLGLHTSRSMRAAMRLYERMGFVRDPEHDFHPPGAELVEGYLLRLDDPAPAPGVLIRCPFARRASTARSRSCSPSLARALPALARRRAAGPRRQLGDLVDVGLDFRKPLQPAFVASRLTAFDPATGRGTLQWDRYTLGPATSFEKTDVVLLARARPPSFPAPSTTAIRRCRSRSPSSRPRTLRLRF